MASAMELAIDPRGCGEGERSEYERCKLAAGMVEGEGEGYERGDMLVSRSCGLVGCVLRACRWVIGPWRADEEAAVMAAAEELIVIGTGVPTVDPDCSEGGAVCGVGVGMGTVGWSDGMRGPCWLMLDSEGVLDGALISWLI